MGMALLSEAGEMSLVVGCKQEAFQAVLFAHILTGAPSLPLFYLPVLPSPRFRKGVLTTLLF